MEFGSIFRFFAILSTLAFVEICGGIATLFLFFLNIVPGSVTASTISWRVILRPGFLSMPLPQLIY